MPRISVVFLSLLLGISLSVSAHAQKHRKTQKISAKAVQPEPQPQPATTPAPEPPPTPEKGPASPPEVSFEGGQLTIVARNSTMGDVLNAVKQKTGAAVEMPMISSERVVGRFGPGAPRDVMAQLLNGSHYNYVLIGSPADPGALNKVVLMARASGPEAAPASAQEPGSQPPGFQGNQNLQAVPEVDNEQNPEETNGEVSPEVPQQQEEEAPPDQQGQQNGPVVKTPEQLLRELQQQQQQQQQQQGQQQQDVPPPGAPGQPPQ